MNRKTVVTDKAPRAIGPYSQAIVVDGWVYTSGQIPIDPSTGALLPGDISDQTRRVLDNLKAVLVAAGSDLDRVVKTTVYLRDINDFTAMNAVYAEYFVKDPPARATIQAARLPKDAPLEIDCIARI